MFRIPHFKCIYLKHFSPFFRLWEEKSPSNATHTLLWDITTKDTFSSSFFKSWMNAGREDINVLSFSGLVSQKLRKGRRTGRLCPTLKMFPTWRRCPAVSSALQLLVDRPRSAIIFRADGVFKMDKSDACGKVDQQSGIAASHLASRAAIRNITEAEEFSKHIFEDDCWEKQLSGRKPFNWRLKTTKINKVCDKNN